ncbi:MAG: fumarylacetoacetate hydrolase family protein [Pseudomonadota bacterium]|jgi:2-keto-4-pentenoate hydratase/2-oxohepta-3-ene-1,7-dioic acid hydratase in catechol pathway|nr:fumarylacetoacetate hydrolase family protein [Pseudomonadota bacterium]
MRLLAFQNNGKQRIGVLRGDQVVDLSIAAPGLPEELVDIIEGGDDCLKLITTAQESANPESLVHVDELDWLPPTRKAGKIICLGLNYAAHAAEGGHDRPEYPSFFMRGNSSLVAHGKPIIRPIASETLDYEAELVAIVGKKAKHVKQEDALDYIWGYSVFNEASIRQYQRKTAQWTIGKNFDNTGGFGPIVVTADEVPPGADGLQIQTRLNGEVLQNATTDMMLFNVKETIELLTECLTLEPGDLLVMGTPSGVGHARKPPLWMKAGDICEIEIENIGILRNPIEDEIL